MTPGSSEDSKDGEIQHPCTDRGGKPSLWFSLAGLNTNKLVVLSEPVEMSSLLHSMNETILPMLHKFFLAICRQDRQTIVLVYINRDGSPRSYE